MSLHETLMLSLHLLLMVLMNFLLFVPSFLSPASLVFLPAVTAPSFTLPDIYKYLDQHSSSRSALFHAFMRSVDPTKMSFASLPRHLQAWFTTALPLYHTCPSLPFPRFVIPAKKESYSPAAWDDENFPGAYGVFEQLFHDGGTYFHGPVPSDAPTDFFLYTYSVDFSTGLFTIRCRESDALRYDSTISPLVPSFGVHVGYIFGIVIPPTETTPPLPSALLASNEG